jgi:copper chaperone
MNNTQTHEIKVKGMTCQHCVKAVTLAVQALDPDALITIDLAQGKAEVTTHLNSQAVVEAISEEGYSASV